MDNIYSLTSTFASIAFETSINTCKHGVPFGGSLSWIYIVLMSNDSGQYPWAPFQAAIIGFPIVIVCDIALFIPALIIRYLFNHFIARY
jgi:hypothetical protein